MNTDMSDSQIETFLQNQRTLIVATTRSNGSPVMHAVWFVYLERALYINIQRSSFKFRNILRDDRVCALVEDGESYFDLKGVSVEGHASEVTDSAEIERVEQAMADKDQRLGSGMEEMPAHFRDSRKQRLGRGDRVLVKIPLERVRSWDFGKSRSHYQS